VTLVLLFPTLVLVSFALSIAKVLLQIVVIVVCIVVFIVLNPSTHEFSKGVVIVLVIDVLHIVVTPLEVHIFLLLLFILFFLLTLVGLLDLSLLEFLYLEEVLDVVVRLVSLLLARI
jgi:hypothetical protein